MTSIWDQALPAAASAVTMDDEARWRELVDKVLKGADFDQRLIRPTYDGIPVLPLYKATAVAPGLPGSAPYSRGAAAAGAWDIRQRHGNPDPAVLNAQILEDLERGVTSIQLDPAAVDFQRALAGVHLDLAPVGLSAGMDFVAAAHGLLDMCRQRGLDPAAVRADLNADPLGAALDPPAGLPAGIALAGDVAAAWPAVTTLLADGRPYHAGGASEAQELACVVATGICYLRGLVDSGLPATAAARQIGFTLAADADFFLTVAKFRALRRLWGRVLDVASADAAMTDLRLHAETATRMFSRRDPYVNVLRGTVAAFAAAAGGAGSITVLPFDHAIGPPSAVARRIARNTQLVLQEESYLGRVIDPAGGSWCVESLTEQLGQHAWALVQEIEHRGGMLAALQAGWPQSLVAATWAERQRNIATRREPITGVSEFPDRSEQTRAPTMPEPAAAGPIAPIPAHRLGEGFERLRDRSDAILATTGERPRVFLCNLGRLDEFGARATFATNLFEAGGFAVVVSDPMASLEEVGHAFKASGARQAAICSSDANYATWAEPAARELKYAHCARVHLMGRPDEAARTAWAAAGVDAFVYAGADVLETLERAHALEAGEAA
jgi:methylmalonyl-CoA mutase